MGSVMLRAYGSMQVMALLMMSCKSAASAMSFIGTGRRFAHWAQHCGEEKTSASIYILNGVGVFVGTAYALNVFGTILGNIDKADCLDFGDAATYSMATGGGAGGFAFNFGCGASIVRIPMGVVEAVKAWRDHRDDYRRPTNDDHGSAHQPLLEAGLPRYGFTDQTEPPSSPFWLAQYDLPNNLNGILEPADSDNLSHSQQLRQFWKRLSAFIARNNLKARTVPRDNHCLYHALIEMFDLDIKVEQLKRMLLEKLHKLKAGEHLSEAEEQFVLAMGQDQLAILDQQLTATSPLANQLPDQAMAQLAALTLNQPITLMTIEGLQLISPNTAGNLLPQDVNAPVAVPLLVQNGINHWSWLQQVQDAAVPAPAAEPPPVFTTETFVSLNHTVTANATQHYATTVQLNPGLISHIFRWTQ